CRFACAPRSDVCETGDRRQIRDGSGGERDRPRSEHAVPDPYPALTEEAPVSSDELDARRGEPVDLPRVLPLAGERVASGQNLGDIEFSVRGLARTGDPASRAQRLTAAQQRLRRHACPVRALAADEFGFDDRRAQSVLARIVGDVLSDRTGSEDDEVEAALAVRALDTGTLLISGLIQVELSFACCRCRLGHRVDSERFNYRPCRSCWQGDGQRITVRAGRRRSAGAESNRPATG